MKKNIWCCLFGWHIWSPKLVDSKNIDDRHFSSQVYNECERCGSRASFTGEVMFVDTCKKKEK